MFLKIIDEHYNEGAITVTEADFFVTTDRRISNKVKRTENGKRSSNFDENVVGYQDRKCFFLLG